MKITKDDRIRIGSAIGYREGVVVWYGPIDRFPPNRSLDEVAVNGQDAEAFSRQLTGQVPQT